MVMRPESETELGITVALRTVAFEAPPFLEELILGRKRGCQVARDGVRSAITRAEVTPAADSSGLRAERFTRRHPQCLIDGIFQMRFRRQREDAPSKELNR
jgi:hypothetical protein